MRGKKYASEEERLAAKRAQARRWYHDNLEHSREYYQMNRERILAARMAVPYGQRREKKWRERGLEDLTWDEFQGLRSSGCAVCGAMVADGSGRDLHADHDHVSGSFRDVLCTAHNLERG